MENVALGFDMESQFTLLFYSLIIGAALGAVFDVMRISRVLISLRGEDHKTPRAIETVLCVVSFVEDIAFFLISSTVLVLFCFQANGGSSRGFILLGALGGFFLYLSSVGRLTQMISSAIARLIYRLLAFLRRRILLPAVRLLAALAKRIYKLTLYPIVRAVLSGLRVIYTEKSARELKKYCSRLFIETKGLRDEAGTDVHTGKARDILGVPVYDNHPRRRTDSVQSARGGTRQIERTH